MNLAYIAGLIDADGSIGFTKSKSSIFVPRVTITNTNLEILEDIRTAFGGNIQPLSCRKDGWKKAYYWQICNSTAVKFIAKVEKWLRIKQENAWLLYAWDFLRQIRKGRITEDDKQALHLLNQQSKWLNFRGEGRREISPVDEELQSMGCRIQRAIPSES
jgi:hypothetical protein